MPHEFLRIDAEAPGSLLGAARRVTTDLVVPEVTLLFSAGDSNSLKMTRALTKQLDVFDVPTLIVAERIEDCETLGTQRTRSACLWSSRVLELPPARSVSLDRFWDGRFRFYAAKKRYLAELFRAGFVVFQADSDSIWQRNPWPVIRNLPERCSIVVQQDGPFANAGMIIARKPSQAAQRLLDEVAWRVQMFQHRPSVIGRLVAFARRPYYANSDDQTILNDAIQSAVLGAPRFLGSQARFEAINGHNPHATKHWRDVPESASFARDVAETWRRSTRIPWNGTSVVAFPMYDDSTTSVCIAPETLIGHAPHRPDHYVTHLAAMRGMRAKLRALCDVGIACEDPPPTSPAATANGTR